MVDEQVGSPASVLCLATVAFVCGCILRPIRFSLRRGADSSTPARIVTLNHVTASVLGVLVLWVTGIISLSDIAGSLIRVGAVQPWAVLVIFFTLAYASISVDCTGLSKYIALKVLVRFGGDDSQSAGDAGHAQRVKRRRLVVVYLLSGIIAVIASNDVVVLTLTPVLVHYCSALRIDPMPVLLAEYYGANTFSAFLLVGNPTNIIAAQGANLSFARYLALLFLPTSAAVVGYVVVLHLFGIDEVPAAIPAHDEFSMTPVVPVPGRTRASEDPHRAASAV
jgi:Na+/H+ antiporter NhaD/arsenite permease-like protein